MVSRINQKYDLSEHKRKIFFERLSPKTTKDSLEQYLSGFEIELCRVPYKEGKSQGYGFVIFRKESSVNNVMSKRPHTIDGQRVELYRSVPDQGSLKDNKGIKDLIVSGLKNGQITQSDLENCFCGFGRINSIKMNSDQDSCCIQFDDYDSVDKALQDRPHIIKNIEIQLTKGSRKNPFDNTSSPTPVSTAWNNNTSVVRKKSNMKQVQIDPQIVSMNIPKKIYCVHIKNLTSNVDAEILSKNFNWPIHNILMNSSTDNQSSSIECWLKGIDEQQIAKDIVQRWDGQMILRSKIECEIEEDKLELCNKFRIGTCPKENEYCDWEHIVCTANGRCSNDCPYGHNKGVKSESYYDQRLSESYYIKITGFREKLTQDILTRILNEKNCYVDRSDDSIGYIGPLRTIKYARRLISKWRDALVDGEKLQCQIEWNSRPMMNKTLHRSGSIPSLVVKENNSRRPSRSYQSQDSSTNNSREPSVSRGNSDSNITTLDSHEFNYEGRLYDRSVEDIVKQKESDVKRKTKSIENLSLSVDRKSLSVNDISECGRRMTKVKSKIDHGSFAFLIEYNDTNEQIYRQELNALRILKGVEGVVQLIELKSSPDNNERQTYSKNKYSILTKHTPGHSLKKFINEIHRGGFGVLDAVQLVQNLITIIKRIHSKDVLHLNLGPENIMIEWDFKQTSVDQAKLILINFSQAYIRSEKNSHINQSNSVSWYKAPQANVEWLKYTSSIDASSVCAILLWLLTNTDPRHDQDKLPHQQDNTLDKLDNKIAQAVRNTNANIKQGLEEAQLKNYLIDTFNLAFGYPEYQPWTINDLECRLESIRELLSPRNSKLDTTDAIFKDWVSSYNNTAHSSSSTINHVQHDLFQKAAMEFQKAKNNFSNSNNDQYSWSDGGCAWLDNIQTETNERRHDDILTYDYRDGRMSGSCSIIITCLATLTDDEHCITLSISSVTNGRTCRIPIGRYSKTQNFAGDMQKNFTTELGNLIKSIAKERRIILQ